MVHDREKRGWKHRPKANGGSEDMDGEAASSVAVGKDPRVGAGLGKSLGRRTGA